jgi:hypothetical protein
MTCTVSELPCSLVFYQSDYHKCLPTPVLLVLDPPAYQPHPVNLEAPRTFAPARFLHHWIVCLPEPVSFTAISGLR